jgi:hypothetical protein
VALARERPLGLFPQFMAPAVEHALWDPQVAGDLRDRLLAALAQAHRFHLEFTGRDVLVLVPVWLLGLLLCLGSIGHGSCPLQLREV